jgi:hypothetical protein
MGLVTDADTAKTRAASCAFNRIRLLYFVNFIGAEFWTIDQGYHLFHRGFEILAVWNEPCASRDVPLECKSPGARIVASSRISKCRHRYMRD